MPSLLLWLMPRRPCRSPWPAFVACLGAALVPTAVAAAEPAKPVDLGVAIVPHDAAFLSSSLRLREQYDRIVNSNAFAAVRALPAVARALESFEEQRATPGSPFSMVETFLQLPENKRAADLLADMVATDTFLYGDPSCVTFLRLVRKLGEAQQRASLAGAGGDARIAMEKDVVADADGAAELALEVEGDLDFDGNRAAGIFLETLADNLDLLVVPDLVWGFRTTKREIATDQLERIAVLAKMVLAADPDLADALERRQVAGVEMLTFTLDGDRLPWDQLEGEIAGRTGDEERTAKVVDRLRSLDVVVAIGLVGDRVILSVGDSVEHLEKLAVPGGDGEGLLGQPAFEPLREHLDKPLTGISYVSQPLAEALGPSRADVESLVAMLDEVDGADDLPDEVVDEIVSLGTKVADEYAKRLPEPGPWLAFSFLTDQGYEGYVWDRSRNQPFDGSKRLDLLGHAGGAPLGVVVSRLRSDPEGLAAAFDLAGGAWKLLDEHGRSAMGTADREKFDAFVEHIAPLGPKFAAILRDKLVAALADGQVGLVLDAKTRTKRLQDDLPATEEPLPLVEPAIVLPLADAKLFREGLSDLFALADELTEAVREIDPDAVPDGYRVPEPEKAKVEGGSVWSWPLAGARLDEQLRPAIGVGETVAVFSFLPKQAARMLVESRLETGSRLSKFDEPLAGAAALDVAGLIDALRPWVVYFTRYGCVQERDGSVAADATLTAADETDEAREALAHAQVVFEALKSLRAAVAETSFRDDALVTHWRNVIRDMPAK